MPTKTTAPHAFVAGDHIAVDAVKFLSAIKGWTNPENDRRIASDTYRIVQAYATNPFVAAVSDTTGRRMGLHVRVLIRIP
jgi:hypothetical protein